MDTVRLEKHFSRITVGDVVFGGSEIVVMAGPCAVENEKQILQVAQGVKEAGARVLRGGAFKPRSSPYSFQGLEIEGLRLLEKAKKETGLLIITELMDEENIEIVCQYSDLVQIGSRNMHNFSLLKKMGKIDKPVVLKRGYAAKIDEWLLAAEYIISHGNAQVILCERGIRTFDYTMRNTLDLSAVAYLKSRVNFPIIVDPSHGTGRRELVKPMAKAAITAGADGLLIEVHPQPEKALCDGNQSLTVEEFTTLMKELASVCSASQKELA